MLAGAVALGLRASNAAGAVSTRLNLGDVLPLGDSVTLGEGSPGGYRSPFLARLTADGYGMQFVGHDSANPSPDLTLAGQTAEEGSPGFEIGSIDAGLVGPVPNGGGTG